MELDPLVMSSCKIQCAAYLVCCCACAAQLSVSPSSVKTIYVERFSAKDASTKLRASVLMQLGKLGSISIVSDPSKADATLSGEGEIWVKGYQSLNPRSGRLPGNGNPLYGGFLSVELKDRNGETMWSYLASPNSASEDIYKELSKRVEKQLAALLDNKSGAIHR